MARESKYITLAQNILLEYIYDDDNLKKEDYHVVNNLNITEKTYASKIGQNSAENSTFSVDPILKKYSKVDSSKYNFLKIGSFSSNYIHFDTVRLHLPTTYSFVDHEYIGLSVKIYAFDYENKRTVNLASYLYDDTEVGANKNMIYNEEFQYSEQQYGKYLTFDIPSLYDVSRQRTNSVSSDLVLSNTINANLAANGLNPESPIFFDFSWVISRQEILGYTYYYYSDLHQKSISNQPEYQTLGVDITESDNGDYYEISGTYNQSNESLDDWVDEMTAKGRKMKIEYQVSLFEENILTNQQTYTVSENFSQKILYRPIITFSNTVAAIDVEMNVIDLFDDSRITKFTSIGMKNNILKYGRSLNRINIDGAYKPKIYNQKVLNVGGDIEQSNTTNIDLTKVNFPVIVDRVKVLTTAAPSTDTEYKSMGLAEVIINPFGALLKFEIAKTIDDSIVPYDLTEVTENSTITLSFKDDTNFLEKDIWQQTTENNFKTGTILYKIDENDIATLKTISKNNNNFYITVKGSESGVRTLLYSGKFVFFEDVQFLQESPSTTSNFDYSDFSDFGYTDTDIEELTTETTTTTSNKNLFVFLSSNALRNPSTSFETYLSSINADVNFKQAGGNDNSLTYMYFILNVTPIIISEIKLRTEVDKVVELEFCIGKNNTRKSISVSDINSMATSFNCYSTTNSISDSTTL